MNERKDIGNTFIYEQLYANRLDNLNEMDKFLERHKVPLLFNVVLIANATRKEKG